MSSNQHQSFRQRNPGTALLLVIIAGSLVAALGGAIVLGVLSLAFPGFAEGVQSVLSAGGETSVAGLESAGIRLWMVWIVAVLGNAVVLHELVSSSAGGGDE